MTALEIVDPEPVAWLGGPAYLIGNPYGETDGWTCLLLPGDDYLIRAPWSEIAR